MDPRNVPLRLGDVRWLFQTLRDPDELSAVVRVLNAADDLLHQAGQLRGDAPDATFHGIVPANRLYYQRLGPGPDTAVLMAEGTSDHVNTDLICAPRDPEHPERAGPVRHPGPPWQVLAWVSCRCESDPRVCPDHEVLTFAAPLATTPHHAAQHIHDAASWLLDHAADPIPQLRQLDP